MSKINIGDKVVITRRHSENFGDVGMEGIVLEIDEEDPMVPYRIQIMYEEGKLVSTWVKDVLPVVECVQPWQGSILKFKFV